MAGQTTKLRHADVRHGDHNVGQVVGTAAARAPVRMHFVAFAIRPLDNQTLFDADALPGNDFLENSSIAAAVMPSLDAVGGLAPVGLAAAKAPSG
jgi:hypothetical protein